MNDSNAKQRRERIAQNAMATCRLEVGEVPDDLQSMFEAYVEGTRTLEQLLAAALARHSHAG